MQLIDREWNDERCAELEAELVKGTGAIVLDKEDNFVMRGVAEAFGVGRQLGLLPGVPAPKEFLENYATTLGMFVFIPRKWSRKQRILVLLHELVHVEQFFADPIRFVWLYLTVMEALAAYEAQAYRTGPEALAVLEGDPSTYTPESVCAGLTQGYNLNGELGAKARVLAGDMSEIALTSIANGVLRTKPVLRLNELLAARGGPRWLLG